ncbi:MAG: PEP-CTERM sorting domain-containing protein [Nostoc sp. NMS7]|uniref:DVUA0089 family protein n=1 Tax=Nostoc sp. NMS7 TaxID=2815391 RepID=UPI0025DEF51E|nr:DVUA0089 family protein [Nostoc sp. NMS7]MBN3948329.1 PEP-CTERM sorting domain-containing protein [Nostoc sp. NMS7]
MATVNVLTNLSLTTVGAAVIALGAGGTAQAATYTELGDAGKTLKTAQNLPRGINVIKGTISSKKDADLFSFFWDSGRFKATTVDGASFDTLLELFDSSGTVIALKDDSKGTAQSTINQFLDTGEYFLGISSFPNFDLDQFGINYGTIPGLSSGDYSITLNKKTASIPKPISVPEPASLIGILGLGALGITSVRKRKQQVPVKA